MRQIKERSMMRSKEEDESQQKFCVITGCGESVQYITAYNGAIRRQIRQIKEGKKLGLAWPEWPQAQKNKLRQGYYGPEHNVLIPGRSMPFENRNVICPRHNAMLFEGYE